MAYVLAGHYTFLQNPFLIISVTILSLDITKTSLSKEIFETYRMWKADRFMCI